MSAARLMIVEDEGLVALDLRSRLEDLGYVVVYHASTGAEAIDQARTTTPDLVLMDIRLGDGTDGIDTADHLRKQLGLPVVFVTAHSDAPTLKRAQVTEPYGYVLKPFRDRDLQIAIDIGLYKHSAVLERERLVKELQEALARVRTLQDLLPICVHCKRLRHDEGYWTAVDEYLSKYSDVRFTHGICEECFQEHYPEDQ